MSKLIPLTAAIERHVRPGMHLHFASLPARSNAAIRELGRRFCGLRPGFVLSATGFHSSAHLLGLLRLGRKYVGCFFGDNYPSPRPNRLYQELANEGAVLEHWSLMTYVLALRAAALGHPYAVTQSLAGTTLGDRLAQEKKFFLIPDPSEPSRMVGLVAPLAPDVAFVHAPAATASGRAIFSPPYGEGFYGALAASRGVIVTTEKVVDEAEVDAVPELAQIPRARVLSVCEEPFGSHPQPLHFAPPFPPITSYGDDFDAYERWRDMAQDRAAFQPYERDVLGAPDGAAAYRAFVGERRLESLLIARQPEPRRRAALEVPALERDVSRTLSATERHVLLAGRTIARRVREASYDTVLAGIGQSFGAARLGLLLLDSGRDDVELTIETGISGLDCRDAHPFLLSRANMASAKRLSSVDTDLGVVACGGTNACLAVVGSAQTDEIGNVNSSFVGGRWLVGSGGANDLASSAREVVVLCPLERLVSKVEFVTSHGQRVRSIVTEECVLERDGYAATWKLTGQGLSGASSEALRARLPFRVSAEQGEPASPPTTRELELLRRILGKASEARSETRAHA